MQLNAAAPLLVRLPRFSRLIMQPLHWLLLIVRIQFKILCLTYNAFLGQDPRYLYDLNIKQSTSATFGCPLRSSDRHDILVPQSRATTAQQRANAPDRTSPLEWSSCSSLFYQGRMQVLSLANFTSSPRSHKTFLFWVVVHNGAPLISLYRERQNIIECLVLTTDRWEN